ncbi:hypothetical protein MTO96_011755 [Rhipicephalus appendiculatus]
MPIAVGGHLRADLESGAPSLFIPGFHRPRTARTLSLLSRGRWRRGAPKPRRPGGQLKPTVPLLQGPHLTYPKCGTHWIQQISQLILNRGASAGNYLEFQMKTPFLEFTGTSDLDSMPPPRLLKTHFAFDRQPYHKDAKYVYMVRNPRDCCVSFYHHSRCIPGYQFADGSFDDFFEVFIRGETDFGDYFDNLLSWYEHKDDPNVLFLTYEDLKKDTRSGVLRLARFFGKKYAEPLEKDPGPVAAGNGAAMEPVRKMFVPRDGRDPTIQFIRKGQVGDWRGHFTPEQESKMRARIRRRPLAQT